MALSRLERRLLRALPADGSPASAEDIAQAGGFEGVVQVLRAAGAPEREGLVAIQEQESVAFDLNEEGHRFKAERLPERRAVEAIHKAGGSLPMGELASAAGLAGPEVKVAIGWLKRKGWADIEAGQMTLHNGLPPTGADEDLLVRIQDDSDADEETVSLLRDRGILIEKVHTVRLLSLTPAGVARLKSLDDEPEGLEVNQVTPAFIAHWEEMSDPEKSAVELRTFDMSVPVAATYPGKAHPLSQMMQQIRDIFWSMGFQEIAGDYVESAFWNMDALFIPQDHPAREMQDTFYLEHPATLPVADEDLARGKAVHESGGDTGSTGWGGSFDMDVSRRALLRTHTTNTTVRYLAEHPEAVCKVFGLGKVFRKETMDATHLPEFYQIEGIVHEEGASFNMLVGLCREFFTRMGFPQVRFRPAYFPYTEPSMEIDVWYNEKWMELGGCGVFRPEVTEPLGVSHPVLAWGLGLERLAMMRLGLTDIRDLYVSDVQWLRETPLQ